MPLAALGSGHSALRFASVLRYASHCLTACSMPLTQFNPRIISVLSAHTLTLLNLLSPLFVSL
ncbi:MAG: hypothetical protein RML94_05915 [Bacteroidia bacterium]|nr:hypothetical protein [Bacteroidia bacterium]